MFRHAAYLLAAGLVAWPVAAHEFWIEPQAMRLAMDDTLRPVVNIGTEFDGIEHPFDPRAYRQVIWTAAQSFVGTNGARVDRPKVAFTAQAPGLHVLAVESNPQVLSHASNTEFLAYIEEVGLSGHLDTTDPGLVPGGPVIERYQRFSKTLVHFGNRVGEDIRVGLQYEWVQQDDGLQLFAKGEPRADHPAFLFCRQDGQNSVELNSYRTDAQGYIYPSIEARDLCLLNATFVTRQIDRSWLSAWTSIFFEG